MKFYISRTGKMRSVGLSIEWGTDYICIEVGLVWWRLEWWFDKRKEKE